MCHTKDFVQGAPSSVRKAREGSLAVKGAALFNICPREFTYIFPFVSDSKEYHVCAKFNNKFWCATAVGDSNKYTTWDYCVQSKCLIEGQITPSTSPSTAAMIVSTTAESKCMTTRNCIFPFVSDSMEYNACAKWAKSHWCASLF